MENLNYIYDGTIRGFFSCVFTAYENKEDPANISVEEGLQVSFGQKVKYIETSVSKADRVHFGFEKKAGGLALSNLQNVLFSKDPSREIIAFRYMKKGFEHGRKVVEMLADSDVLEAFQLSFKVNREVQHMTGFLRFSLMENGVYFAKIAPTNNIVSLIMPHFVDRFSVQPFVIYDEANHTAGIYDLKDWQVLETGAVQLPKEAEGEAELVSLWRHFCQSVTIKTRANLKTQMNFCPKKYWQNMPEMWHPEYTKGKETEKEKEIKPSNKKEKCLLMLKD